MMLKVLPSILMILILCSAFPMLNWNVQVEAQPRILEVPTMYSTIQQAVNNASGGDTVFVRSGIYYEDVVVNKSIVLIGESRESTVIRGENKPQIVHVSADNATVSNLTIRKSGSQIGITGLFVTSRGNSIVNNNISGNYQGMAVYSDNNTLLNNVIANNQIGVTLYLATYSIFTGNNVSQNDEGVNILSTGHSKFSDNSISANRVWGMAFAFASSNNIFYHNNLQRAVEISGDSVNTWDYGGEGNYWIGHICSDLNDDGIGDQPYIMNSNNRDNFPLRGPFSAFLAFSYGKTYQIEVISNSTIHSFNFVTGSETGRGMIKFSVTGNPSTIGFCRIMIPTELMSYQHLVINKGDELIPTLLSISNESNAYLYFAYTHEDQIITILSSTTLRLYHELLDQYSNLLEDLANMNSTYHDLLIDYNNSLQQAIDDLSLDYQWLLANYTDLALNYSRLLQEHASLNSSYQEQLPILSANVENMRSISYIVATMTILFLLTTVYLSRSFSTRRQRKE